MRNLILSKVFCLTLPFFLAYLLIGCAQHNQSLVEQTYDSIKVANTSVDRLMTKVGEYYQEGKISEDRKSKINDLYAIYRSASNSASEALAEYKELETVESKERLQMALASLNKHRADLKSLIFDVLDTIPAENEEQ